MIAMRVSILLVALLVSITPAFAEGLTFWHITENVVKASKVAKYEATMKGYAAKAGQKMEAWVEANPKGDQLSYIYLTPMKDFSFMSNIKLEGDKLAGTDAATRQRWSQDLNDSMVYMKKWMAVERPELSYKSPHAIKHEDVNYVYVKYIYVKPGSTEAAEKLFKDWVALYKKQKSPLGFNVSTAFYGELPMYVVAVSAKSAEDLKSHQGMKDEEELAKRMMKLARRHEMKGYAKKSL